MMAHYFAWAKLICTTALAIIGDNGFGSSPAFQVPCTVIFGGKSFFMELLSSVSEFVICHRRLRPTPYKEMYMRRKTGESHRLINPDI